jgi:NarL family two-component system response regulator LiaR
MDLAMPQMDGIEATRLLRQRHPGIRVIVLTSYQEEDLVERALQAGAISYLLKDIPAKELGDAIRAAYAGRSTLAPEVTQMLIHVVARPPRVGYDLTEREVEVLRLMTIGLSNAQIGERIMISRNTVRYHVRNILSKLHADNRTGAVALAMQHELVPVAPEMLR